MEFGQFDTHSLAQYRVEIRQRFVERKRFGIADDRPADRQALALAARHGGGLTIEQFLEFQNASGISDPLMMLTD
jgi:hypothetical protein